MNHSDITLIPPRARSVESIDQQLDAQLRIISAAREQTLRDLARPYLRAGYVPSELTAVERASDWLHVERMFVCVQVATPRCRTRLWFRRAMRRIGLFHAPRIEGCLWHG